MAAKHWTRALGFGVVAVTLMASPTRSASEGVATAQCVTRPIATPSPDRSRYTVSVRIDPAKREVRGHVHVTFVPDLPVTELVFRTWANGPDSEAATDRWPEPHEQIGAVTVHGHPVTTAKPDPTTLVVDLGRTVSANQRIEADLDYDLRLPRTRNDRISAGKDWVRIGSFLPLLAWEPGIGWSRIPATPARAEASMFPAADFTMTVDAPADYSVLATGERDASQTWHVTGARDVGISAGRFRVAEGTAFAGSTHPVKVSVGVASDRTQDDPYVYLRRALEALAAHGERYGPYAWPSLSLAVTPNLSGGIEYPGSIMLGSDPTGVATSHEVAHQWFYALVGNDQGRNPWLDEGLTSWAEARMDGQVNRYVARVDAFPTEKLHMGAPVSYWETVRPVLYALAVYAGPVAFLNGLGSAEDVDCALRDYVARNAYRIARPTDLTTVLRQHFPDTYPRVAKEYGLD